VVRDEPADHLVLVGLADPLEVRPGQLPRRLDSLRAARREEDPVEVARRERGDPLGKLDRGRVRVRPQREERQLGRLLGGGLGKLGPAVAGVHHEEAGEAVEVAAALGVPHVGTFAADDRGHLAIAVTGQAREMHPEVIGRVTHATITAHR
jgi:hypothetical protein